MRGLENLARADVMWQAICNNDKTADGQFFYGVTSTGIFCRPSCHSRLPKRANVRLFTIAEDAMAAGFRPCKRCRPTGTIVAASEWVKTIKQIIEQYYAETLTLSELAQRAHGAPFYLHHVFQQQTGQTPMAYLRLIRLAHARALLTTTDQPIAMVAKTCGFQSAAYFSTQFKQAYHQTPRQFRQQH